MTNTKNVKHATVEERLQHAVKCKQQELDCINTVVDNLYRLKELYTDPAMSNSNRVFYNKLEIEKWEYVKTECVEVLALVNSDLYQNGTIIENKT